MPVNSPGPRSVRVMALAAAIVLAVVSQAGCAAWADGPGYYLQSIAGQLALMRAARPIAGLLHDPALDPALRDRLGQVVEIRRYASAALDLPDNGSYTAYAELQRPYAVWNVFAAPALSLQLRQWCFPVAGCVSYRGYFDHGAAQRYAARLAAEGYETYVAGVPAYSTLGWFDDPVLSTFVRQPEVEVARLIFHELAHQLLYVKGDTTFNESFASTVEQVGLERWVAAREAATGDGRLREAWRAFAARRGQFLALLARHRRALEAVYASDATDDAKRAARQANFAALRREYQDLKRRWGGYAGYDRWFAQPLNNAHLASVATYTDDVPAFRALLAREGGELPAFYAAARRLAVLPKVQRDRALAELVPPAAAPATGPASAPAPGVPPLTARTSGGGDRGHN